MAVLVILAVCLVGFQIIALTFVSASLCQIMNVSNDYPQTVQPNQQFLLMSTISAVCAPTDPGVYYLALVVVQDANSGRQITSNSVPIGYVSLQQPNVTATVTNLITPPSGNVAWQLKLIVYIINDYNQYFSPYTDTALTQYLTVNVGTIQQIVSTTTSSATSIMTASTTNETTTSTFTSMPTTTTSSGSSVLAQSLAIVGLALVVILLITFWKRRAMNKRTDNQPNSDTTKND